jgi:hypothetical protein
MFEKLIKLKDNFQKMEEIGKVEPCLEESLKLLNNSAQDLIVIRENKLKNKKPEEAFNFYHLSLVSSIILDSIKKRLIDAKKMNDNPEIAKDSLEILPFLNAAMGMLNLKKSDENFIDFANEMQTSAFKHNLFQPQLIKKKEIIGAISETIKRINLV